METKTVVVPNISCGHCKMKIEKTLHGMDGVSSASAVAETKTLTVMWEDSAVTWEDIAGALKDIGYPPEE